MPYQLPEPRLDMYTCKAGTACSVMGVQALDAARLRASYCTWASEKEGEQLKVSVGPNAQRSFWKLLALYRGVPVAVHSCLAVRRMWVHGLQQHTPNRLLQMSGDGFMFPALKSMSLCLMPNAVTVGRTCGQLLCLLLDIAFAVCKLQSCLNYCNWRRYSKYAKYE